jgi:hypothetical protein
MESPRQQNTKLTITYYTQQKPIPYIAHVYHPYQTPEDIISMRYYIFQA